VALHTFYSVQLKTVMNSELKRVCEEAAVTSRVRLLLHDMARQKEETAKNTNWPYGSIRESETFGSKIHKYTYIVNKYTHTHNTEFNIDLEVS
jgi:hypothetical protein